MMLEAKGKVRAAGFAALLLSAMALVGCSNDSGTGPGPVIGPQSSSATHFIEECNGTCAAGFECVCGTCTRACTSNTTCTAIFAGASCVVTAESHPMCGDPHPSHVCDVACTTNADCKGLSSAPFCVSGFCRAKERAPGKTDASVSAGGAGSTGGAANGAGGTTTDAGTGISGADGKGGSAVTTDASIGGASASGGGAGDGGASNGGASNGGAGGTPGSGGAGGTKGSCVLGQSVLGECVLGS